MKFKLSLIALIVSGNLMAADMPVDIPISPVTKNVTQSAKIDNPFTGTPNDTDVLQRDLDRITLQNKILTAKVLGLKAKIEYTQALETSGGNSDLSALPKYIPKQPLSEILPPIKKNKKVIVQEPIIQPVYTPPPPQLNLVGISTINGKKIAMIECNQSISPVDVGASICGKKISKINDNFITANGIDFYLKQEQSRISPVATTNKNINGDLNNIPLPQGMPQGIPLPQGNESQGMPQGMPGQIPINMPPTFNQGDSQQ